jgi:hypothetical protein
MVSKRPVQPPEDEISRLFALMMPERAAKSPRQPINHDRVLISVSDAESERDDDFDSTALLEAMAQDRVRRRRREVAVHAVLVAVFCVVALVLVSAELARLLMPLALAR